jgi:hypothetical protein
MRCKLDGWFENSNCLVACDCHLDPRNMKAGPEMVRHVIDGHEVLLPIGAKLYARVTGQDEIELPGLGGCW